MTRKYELPITAQQAELLCNWLNNNAEANAAPFESPLNLALDGLGALLMDISAGRVPLPTFKPVED